MKIDLAQKYCENRLEINSILQYSKIANSTKKVEIFPFSSLFLSV